MAMALRNSGSASHPAALRERMIWAIIVLGEYPCIAARGSLFDLS
jgi:hypothetical protein